MVQYQKGTIYYTNSRFKMLNMYAKIARIEPPCTVIIVYRDERQLNEIKKIINDIIPLGVECKFEKY